MATTRRPKLIIVEEGATAAEVASSEVAPTVGADAEVLEDAVSVMAGRTEPSEVQLLPLNDFGIIEASLSDQEADAVAAKTGIVAVEDDEEVFGAEDDMDIQPVVDEEAEAAIDADLSYAEPEDARAEAAALAARATFLAQTDPAPVEAIDFDEAGNLVTFDPDPVTFAGAAGDDDLMDAPQDAQAPGEQPVQAASTDYITCGLNLIWTPPAWRYSTGAGVRVAVLDTGIAPKHPDLQVWGGVSFVPGVVPWFDDNGHGTHVAGTVAALRNGLGVVGVAPHARLYAVKVLDRSNRGRISWVLNGLAWCARTGMHVVNLSLSSDARTHDPRDYSVAYERAAWRLRQLGALPVAAAGNTGHTSAPYVGNPARCPSYMAVGAVDCNRHRASFSSYGPQVEICAPGVSVWSTYPAATYRQMSGTSMAAPHVSGVAALVKRRRPGWSGSTIRVHLRHTAVDLGAPGRDWFYGHGLVNAFRALR